MSLTLTELIDTEVLNTDGKFFRNREIVDATGASRAHVSQRLNRLYDDGIIEKRGVSWHLVDKGKLVTFLMRTVRAREIQNTKLIRPPAAATEVLFQAIQLLKEKPNGWTAVAMRLEDVLLEDINESLESLREMREQLKHPPRSPKQIYAHLTNSGEYAVKLQKYFVEAVKFYMGEDVSDEAVIIDDIRARALERAEKNAKA